MNPQFYVVQNGEQEQALFHFVREECSMVVLPGVVADDGAAVLPEQCLYLFVNESDVKWFRYVRDKDDLPPDVSVIDPVVSYPYGTTAPYIEYRPQKHEGQIMGRLWLSGATKEEYKWIKPKFDMVKKWVQQNSVTKKREGPLWFYYL